MDALTVISKRANELFRESFTECCRVRDEINGLNLNGPEDQDRTSIAKKNLMDSAQLAGQIIRALDGGSTLLGLIGLRSLVESLINTKYAFNHPSPKPDKTAWARSVCDDYFKRGNDPKARKNLLNEEGVAARAKDSGESDLYEKTYGGLCNYSHMLVHTALPNDPVKFEDFTRNGYVQTLTTLHDIREHVRTHFDIKGWPGHEARLIEFRDKYHSEE